MKLYYSTRQIPQLQDLPLTERLVLVQQAEKRLSAPEKWCLNLLKLMIIVPAFVLLLRVSESWFALLGAAAVTLLHPLLLKPIHYGLCSRYIKLPKNHNPSK